MPSSRRSGKPAPKTTSQLRIIGGQWRGRKLTFSKAPGLRPTTDRVRETLFNWLAPSISGARCLDLFAGSGALGLEALSRGAAHCDFVDTSVAVTRQIHQQLETLGALPSAGVHQSTAERFLGSLDQVVDIVFIDPPFDLDLARPACLALAASGRLASDGYIYLETRRNDDIGDLPAQWQVHREKKAGDVRYRLLTTTG